MPKDLSGLRRAHERSAPLHEEIPHWGWLEDGRTLLTVGGELVTLARLETYEASGRPGEYLDYVLERWVRLLSTAGPRTRVYLYLLRRPVRDLASGVASEGARAELAGRALEERRRFLEPRLQALDVVVAWSRDAQLQRKRESRSLLERVREVFGPAAAPAAWARAEIEREARDFADAVDAAAGLVSDVTPLEILAPEPAAHRGPLPPVYVHHSVRRRLRPAAIGQPKKRLPLHEDALAVAVNAAIVCPVGLQPGNVLHHARDVAPETNSLELL